MCLNCHIVTLKTKLKCLESIKRACKRNNWEFRENQETYVWVGRWFDDSPVPRMLFETEEEYNKVIAMSHENRVKYMESVLGKCTHAIHIPGKDKEIGLIERNGEYIPIWDWASDIARDMSSTPMSCNNQDGGPLIQAYTIEKAKLEAQRKGHFCSEQKMLNGSVKLQIRVNA